MDISNILNGVAAFLGVIATTAAYTELRLKASQRRQQVDDLVNSPEAMGRLMDDLFGRDGDWRVVDSDSQAGDNSSPRTQNLQDGSGGSKGTGKGTIEGKAGTPISGLVHSVDESGE